MGNGRWGIADNSLALLIFESLLGALETLFQVKPWEVGESCRETLGK